MDDFEELVRKTETELGHTLDSDVMAMFQADPELQEVYLGFRQFTFEPGEVSTKHKYLMAVAALTAMRADRAVHNYCSIARGVGATPQEIREAVRVGVLFSTGPGMLASARAIADFGRDPE